MARSRPGYSCVGPGWYTVISVAQLFEIRTVWGGVAGSPFYTVLRGDMSGAVTPSAFATAWDTFLGGLQAVSDNALVAVVQPEVRIIESTTGDLVGTTTIAGSTKSMTGATQAVPPTSQLLCRLTTNNFVAGRRIRGRFFIPGILTSQVNLDGTPTAGLTGGINTNLATLKAALGSTWVVYSPTHRVYAVVQSATCWSQFAVLRSRRD